MKILILFLAVLVPLAVFSQNDKPAAPPRGNPEGTVADYKIVQDDDPGQLQRKVNEAIKLGWQPLGALVIVPGEVQTGRPRGFFQTMTYTPRR
jgi:hypothetical protein